MITFPEHLSNNARALQEGAPDALSDPVIFQVDGLIFVYSSWTDQTNIAVGFLCMENEV